MRDGVRQYRTAFIEIPRKNGKSELLAALALYLLFGDGEIGAEVYAAAADKDQARRVFGEARRMIEMSPKLSQLVENGTVKLYKDAIYDQSTGSVFRVLSADAPTKHGLNPSAVIIDELHVHKTRDLWDALTSAQGARKQPLIFVITTAGDDMREDAPCWSLHEYARKVRTGQITDPTFYSVYYGAPMDADWTDPSVWKAANPALGDFLNLEDLEREFRIASEINAEQNKFRRLHLNQWVQQATRWIDLRLWDDNNAHPISDDELKGRRCYGGLDLASVEDMTAWVLVFPCDGENNDGPLDVRCRFWLPERCLTKGRNKELYREWANAGVLSVTPGDQTDYDFLEAAVIEDARQFEIVDFNVDRLFEGRRTVVRLADQGLAAIPFGQGILSMGPPTKELQRRLLARHVHHGGHPILRWMADNVVVRRDHAENIKVDREKSSQKVDGIVALIMAIDRVQRHAEGESVWEDDSYEMLTL